MALRFPVLLLLSGLALPLSAIAAPLILASDEMPDGDDEMPDGDDEMPDGEDASNAAPQANDQSDEMPDGEEDAPPAETVQSPSLVAVPPPAPCSVPALAEGYLQAHLDRARSIDLHGVDATVQVVEGRGECIAQVQVAIAVENNCDLSMRFEQEANTTFSLASLRFNAESCSELTGLEPGRYLLHQGDAELRLNGNVAGACMPKGDLSIKGRLVVKKSNTQFDIHLDGLRVRGDFAMHVDETIGCRERRRAAPVTLSSDRPKVRQLKVWPWLVGGAATLAVGGGAAWYLMTRSPATGSLTLQIQ